MAHAAQRCPKGGRLDRSLWLLALSAVLGLGNPAWAKDSPKPQVKGATGTALDEAVQEAGGAFWGSVLVAKKGKILLAKGYGFGDYDETPNTPVTLFEIASTSKQFVAAAILHLQQKKKLSVQDTLARFFKKGLSEQLQGITLHQLLTHTSGISGRVGVPYAYPKNRKTWIEEISAEIGTPDAPGTFAYCNVGYAMLAAVVEEASGMAYEDYVRKHLLKPAKMKDTGFINDRELIKKKRASVRKTSEPGSWTACQWHYGWGYRGMGGVVTTVYDLLRWDEALRRDKILDKKSKALLYKPEQEGYAYGWRVSKTKRGGTKVEHSGSVAGFGCNFVRYLEEEVVLIVLSNDGKTAYEVTGALERVLFK